MSSLTAIEDNSIKFDQKLYSTDKVDLQKILIYSKIRKCIYSYINARDYCGLSLANRQINYICNKTLKKEYAGILIRMYTGKI